MILGQHKNLLDEMLAYGSDNFVINTKYQGPPRQEGYDCLVLHDKSSIPNSEKRLPIPKIILL